ncbi:MAG TPA: homocysteine S-methyltransferase family protein, partial [Vicinamibacteria bacterium]|nr:homocysteine S-methyltransferase family protein [Vicinamibacteria bacterium]
DTFRANRLTLDEYGLADKVLEMNRVAARIARRAADDFATGDRPRFVAGSIGPSGFLPSTSDPSLGAITYEELADAFAEQATGLVEGGVDVLLIETSQDLLEVKAQIAGIRRALRELGRDDVALQAQVTLDTSGRMLLGTDIAAAATVLQALRVDVIGLNCSTGPEHMREPVRWMAENVPLPISVIPNAGIPHNEAGVAVYPLSPEALAEAHEEFVRELGVSIVGGCCGTTPEHLRQVVERVGDAAPKPRDVAVVPRLASAMTAFDMAQIPAPPLIGERVNAQGARAVKRFLIDDDYESVRDVARGQVEGGAHLLDVCVALTERQDEADQMRALVKLLAQSVETPLVLDTTEADVVEAGLRQYPGRAVINSINLENGRARIDALAPEAVEHGAALVALTIDEEGMAKTAQQKLDIARRITDIVTGEYGLPADALIFDDLTFTLATGEEEYRHSAVETIEGIRAIKRELPGVLTSLGVSNVSFGLQKHARSVLNSVFLHHCVEAGLDMAIVNPAHVTPYAEIDAEQRQLADDLIFDTREDALARFIAFYEEHEAEEEVAGDPTEGMEPEEALHWKILHRKKDGIEAWVDEAIAKRQRLGIPKAEAKPIAAQEAAAPQAGGAGVPEEGADGGVGRKESQAAAAPQGGGAGVPGEGADGGVGWMEAEAARLGVARGGKPPKTRGIVRAAGGDTRAGASSAAAGDAVEDPATPHEAGVYVLNQVLLPAMKEVGDKFGAGELILPFVLQSAEAMKKAVARLETYLEKVEGQSKGKVVLATVFGDVHDIGKNLVHTILVNNGYTVFDLGKQVPANDIIAKAQEVGADAIGLSALLVSTSKQMPLIVQELNARGLAFPVLCGGAAINPSFIRSAAFVDEAKEELYGPGVWYCKDAFEGLHAVERLMDADKRPEFVHTRHAEIREGTARRAELKEKAKAMAPKRQAPRPSREVDIPTAPFHGVKVLERLPLEELFRFIDLNTLYRLHWGAKNAKGEQWERLVREEFEPRLARFKHEALSGGWLRPQAAYGFFPAAADGDALVVYSPDDADAVAERFDFPRQADRDELCLADYFAPHRNGTRDVVGFQLVTVGDTLLERSARMMNEGDYSEGYYLHGFGVRLAEAAAEYVNRL